MPTSVPASTSDDYLRLLSKPGQIASSSSAGPSSSEISDSLKRLRRLILVEGIPEDATLDSGSTRARVWKILLQIGPEDLGSRDYLEYVSRGPSEVSAKIKNDTFRTLATDLDFKGRVKEDMLVRLLEAFVWRQSDLYEQQQPVARGMETGDGKDTPAPLSYVQGMNVLSAPFLYVLPSQIEAFACFVNFIERCLPLYVRPTLTGVHRGLELLDRCLEAVDPELSEHLKRKGLSAELYAFPSVLTMSACTPPLDEVLKLWDFLLAFGVHLNILCIIAQLLLMRQDLLDSTSPMKLLRIFPPLNASSIIGITLALVKDVPEQLYGELVRHPFETT